MPLIQSRSLDTIYQLIYDVVSKQMGEYLTPEQIARALEDAQKQVFYSYLDDYIKSKTKKLSNVILPFRVSLPISTDVNGNYVLPSDCEQVMSFFTSTSVLREVSDVELPDALMSQLRPVTTNDPLMVIGAKAIQAYPSTTYSGTLAYIRTPKAPVYGYTQTGRQITYNPSTTTQLEIDLDEVLAKALGFFGISMSEQDISQFALQKASS